MAEIEVVEVDGRYAVTGNISFDNVGSLYAQLLQAIGKRPDAAAVTIDFKGVDRIDSSAVALLAGVQLAAQKQGARAEFAGLNAEITSLVALYGVGWVVDPEQAGPSTS